MEWLTKAAKAAEARKPKGEIIIESGISPSGGYHMGYLREIILCDAVKLTLEKRGRQAKHVHFVDDLDGFRKLPKNLPASYEQYLGKPLCDIPAPDGSDQSYADYALKEFLESLSLLGVDVEVIRSHLKYRSGFFGPAIEKTLAKIKETRQVLEDISGRELTDDWAPIQVNEDGYLKNRRFVSIDTSKKEIIYIDGDDKQQTISYAKGDVKLNWRLDWPARWWLLDVNLEPFGRDHATKGGSYDTGAALMDKVFDHPAPVSLPYNFVNRAGETKKMSASAGNGILMSEVVSVLPAEVVRYFILKSSPDKLIFFDPQAGVVRLIDEYAELLAKSDKTPDEEQLIELCTHGVERIVSNVPFSHLVESYQAALKDEAKTIEIIGRTEHAEAAAKEAELIKRELKFIASWLDKWASDDVKFSLAEKVKPSDFSEDEKTFLNKLAEKVAKFSTDASGEDFHKAIYDITGLEPSDKFKTLYRLLINQDHGPRAGWFLSILPRDWLIKRLKLQS